MIPGQSSPRWTLVASSFGLAMALLDVTVVNVAVSAIQEGLGTGVRGLSWVIDGYTLAFASLLLLSGGLGDRLGARRMFIAGLAVFTVASALCGVAPGLGTLVFARILQGAGAALFMPSSLAILRQAYPRAQERARAIGIWSALTAVAAASGPVLGGVLVGAFGWRSIFLVNLPLGVVATAMAFRFVRPSPASVGAGLDLLAQLTAAASLALFTWALIERPARGWGSPAILLAMAASLAGLRAFVFLERRSAHPILPLRLFSDRTFSSTASAALLYAGAFFGSVLVLSLDFQQVRGDAPASAGLHLTAITLAFGATSVVAGRLAGRHGTRAPILAGLAALSASAAWVAAMPSAAPYLLLAPALILMGVGAGLVAPSMNAAILASVPPSLSGIGAGVLNASRQVGTALGVAIFASLFHDHAGESAVRISLFWAAGFYLAALVLAARAAGPSALSAPGAAMAEVASGH
ncbi:MAG TPA: DHA2 family efflux MFS transporter permease subunit [Myxococcales bacterium]|nr:DHA2 family efflux MFS transporter permease subunit [Myxococcales bacterium]